MSLTGFPVSFLSLSADLYFAACAGLPTRHKNSAIVQTRAFLDRNMAACFPRFDSLQGDSRPSTPLRPGTQPEFPIPNFICAKPYACNSLVSSQVPHGRSVACQSQLVQAFRLSLRDGPETEGRDGARAEGSRLHNPLRLKFFADRGVADDPSNLDGATSDSTARVNTRRGYVLAGPVFGRKVMVVPFSRELRALYFIR
jgi:hypothetical protein